MSNMSQADDVIRLVPRVMTAGTQSMIEIIEAISKLIKEYEDFKTVKAINDYLQKDGKLDCKICTNISYRDDAKKLTEKGIPYVQVLDSKTNQVLTFTRNCDRERVEDARNEMMQQRAQRNLLRNKEMMTYAAKKTQGKGIMVYDVGANDVILYNVKPNQLKALQERLKDKNCDMTYQKDAEGNYVVRFASKTQYYNNVSNVLMEDMFKINAGQQVVTVNNLTESMVKTLKEQAQRNNLNVAIGQNKSSSKKVFVATFAQKDEEKIKSVMAKVYLSSIGEVGKYNDAQKSADIEAINGVYHSIENPSDEIYIVSALNPNEYIHVTNEGYNHIRNENDEKNSVLPGGREKYSVSRTDARFGEKLITEAHAIIQPVILSQEEFHKSANDKRIIIQNAINQRTMSIEKPTSKIIQNEALARKILEYRMYELIAAKMSLDNGNQPENVSSFFNPDVSFSEFFAHETVNDQHEEEELANSHESAEMPKYIDMFKQKRPEEQDAIREYLREGIEEIQSHDFTAVDVDIDTLTRDRDEFIQMVSRQDQNLE